MHRNSQRSYEHKGSVEHDLSEGVQGGIINK
jgi:hypothetical protein